MKRSKRKNCTALFAAAAVMLAAIPGMQAFASSGAQPAGGTLAEAADGTYTSTTQGFGGDIIAEVTIENGVMTDVKVTGDSETPELGAVAVAELPEKMLAAQSVEVDGMSGATISSNAIKLAVASALAEAGVEMEVSAESAASLAEQTAEKTEETLDVDIVVIGAGGAGMTAAITAKQAGKDVLVLEKMPYVGGNTTKATGGMNAAETHYQKEQNIEDTVEQFVEDTMEGGHQINNRELVTTLAENSADAIDWLDSIGAPLPKVSFSGGATNARIHAPEDGSGVGTYLVEAFKKELENQGVSLLLETKATELILENGRAAGVKAESATTDYTIHAKAVILATGGFGANEDMYTSYRPDLKGTVTTNAPGATGDGVVMAEAAGAALVDMKEIQLHPTVEQNTSIMVTESVRGDGAILVNQSGRRFVNEMETRDVVSAAELEQDGAYAYIIFDQRLRDNLKAIEKYADAGIVTEAKDVSELAEQLGMDAAVLQETMDNWNKAVAEQKDEEFGRDTGMDHDLSSAPYYAIRIAPGIHHTMGGVRIDTDTEVLTEEGNAIAGLFAAGEVTGGVHGGNRIGGNAVADIVVFGRIAGQNASAYVDAQK
ncbi:MAG: flavocytochrome c [Lachnospiraceae bacterium]|nr:flavocytochrome c [Lachnospiraceae bacterium]